MNRQELKHLVLVGGGHSHALFLLAAIQKSLPACRIILISDLKSAPYSGMLPGYVGGFYRKDEWQIDLTQLCAKAQAEFVLGKAVDLDLTHNAVVLADGKRIMFDVLSLNVGSQPNLSNISGAREHCIPVKPLPRFLEFWNKILEEKKGFQRLAIIGGGAGGIELAVNMASRLKDRAEITLFEEKSRILSQHPQDAQHFAAAALVKHKVNLYTDVTIEEIKSGHVSLKNGPTYPFDFIFAATHASPPAWLSSTGIQTTADGFVAVSRTLQSLSHDHIFASGDVATIVSEPRPKSGVFAVRQGQNLYSIIRGFIAGTTVKPLRLQKRYLVLIGTGDKRAIAIRGNWVGRGRIFWWLKEFLDRRFMRQFRFKS